VVVWNRGAQEVERLRLGIEETHVDRINRIYWIGFTSNRGDHLTHPTSRLFSNQGFWAIVKLIYSWKGFLRFSQFCHIQNCPIPMFSFIFVSPPGNTSSHTKHCIIS
jgi:hypothetical protein